MICRTPGNSFCGVFSGGCIDYVEQQTSSGSRGNRIFKGALEHVLLRCELQNRLFLVEIKLYYWKVFCVEVILF